jgi:hypothetical protein
MTANGKLIRLSTRTNNKNEMNPAKAKIGELAGRFWDQNMANQIPNIFFKDLTLRPSCHAAYFL